MFSMSHLFVIGLLAGLLLVHKDVHAAYGYTTEPTIVYKSGEPYDIIDTGEYFKYDKVTKSGIKLGKYRIKSDTCITGDVLSVLQESGCPLYVAVTEDTFALDAETLDCVQDLEKGAVLEVESEQLRHYQSLVDDEHSILIPKSCCKPIYQFTTHKIKNRFPKIFASTKKLNKIIKNFTMPTLGKTNSQIRDSIVEYACQFVGNPYIWGGTNPNVGADCSGFVRYVYKHFGYDLPRVSYAQVNEGTPVTKQEDLKPGDLLFYWHNDVGRVGHVAMYKGDGKCVEAKGRAFGICITDLNWNKVYKAKRILED